ncbi:hypothetical protein BDC45DRAFT_420483, partial [Circinella umbellata]
DCMCFDGLYLNTLDEVIEKYKIKNLNINDDNFIYPIRKQKNIDLTDNEKIFNEQLGSYPCLFLNIKRYSDITEIVPNDYCIKWLNESFDYPNNLEKNKNLSSTISYNINKIKRVQDFQKNNALKLTYDNKDNNNDIQMEEININNNIEKNIYEVAYIIKHKKVNNKFEYFVKWRGYNKNYNSWVKEENFNGNELIENYWNYNN